MLNLNEKNWYVYILVNDKTGSTLLVNKMTNDDVYLPERVEGYSVKVIEGNLTYSEAMQVEYRCKKIFDQHSPVPKYHV